MCANSTNQAIYALISPKIKAHAAEPGTYGIKCSLIPTLPAVIDIGFVDENGSPFNLTIPSSELSVGPFADSPSTCQTLINAFDGLDLVGGSVLKHYYRYAHFHPISPSFSETLAAFGMSVRSAWVSQQFSAFLRPESCRIHELVTTHCNDRFIRG